jgi:hypothetical protein
MTTVVTCFAVVLASCGAPPPPPPVAPAPPATLPAPSGIRPEDTAGLYWVPYVTCDDCDRPQALVAYLTGDEHEAHAIRSALDGKLALGLPYVIHTDELGLRLRKIAVVIGTYATKAAADRGAATSPPVAGHRAATIALAGGTSPEAPRHVTVVDRGQAVPAWSKADVDAVKAALDATADPGAHETLAASHAWVLRQLAARAPTCTVLPGDLFVVEDDELDWYELAPVRCGGQLAYISWTQSLLGHAVIVPRGTGHVLSQIVGAECDSPIIRTWRYDTGGRHDDPAEPAHERVASSGC